MTCHTGQLWKVYYKKQPLAEGLPSSVDDLKTISTVVSPFNEIINNIKATERVNTTNNHSPNFILEIESDILPVTHPIG